MARRKKVQKAPAKVYKAARMRCSVSKPLQGHAKSKRARLIFPVGRVHRKLRETVHGLRVSPGAAVYLAAVLQDVASDVLDLSGEEAENAKKKRISPRHINLAVREEHYLNLLFKNVTIPGCGVAERISKALLPKGKQGKNSKASK